MLTPIDREKITEAEHDIDDILVVQRSVHGDLRVIMALIEALRYLHLAEAYMEGFQPKGEAA